MNLDKKVEKTKQTLQEACGKKGPICVTSSLQTQSIPLLHMISQLDIRIPVIFINTGFHFSQTLEFKNKITKEFNLLVKEAQPELSKHDFLEQRGPLYAINPDLCCDINKMKPFENTLKSYRVWISGIRRDQTKLRKEQKVFQKLENGKTKVCPMLEWTKLDVCEYIQKYDLPCHPLTEAGFKSIGCSPCTTKTKDDDLRSGRWSYFEKTECGLHKRF